VELIQLIDEDFISYKKASMVLGFPKCDFKCDHECGVRVCQNSHLASQKPIEISINEIVDRYITNDITHAIVCHGLEPFDSWEDLLDFIKIFVSKSDDDIVIYTGYTELEIKDKVDILRDVVGDKNTLIIKYGRYIPNQQSHYDEFLGVNLASDNQYSIIENKMKVMS